ncbi:tyrosine-type recombinase/integrase [Acinetobacter indicus]|uniref:tyrosine-type recombinase/integrase n=1 Tax=Acinetobacter indicus TaxID=756892 RepID=UPI002576579E|nr:site-specific integrase [Acinetobacter indicus]MDM1770166.1 site-specific integrase [Acinetobacter indicus]MDM1772832.1 site-specific integrase [Acinetobacter indicus]
MSTKLKNGQSRYQSKAKVVSIKKFQLLTLVNATRCLNDAAFEKHGDAYLEFPVIIQGDGSPSEVFNLYLLKKLEQTIQYDLKTFASIANQLVDFQRFLEDEQLDCLKFHKLKQSNAIFKYRTRLIEQANLGLISVSSARSRINAVVNFYRFLVTEDLVDHQRYGIPFKDVYKYIAVDNEFGARRKMAIKSHDLAIHVPAKAPNPETIADDGELSPLSIESQTVILKALLKSSREYQLMFYFALFTGARLQTICTLRIKNLIGRKPDSQGFIRLPVGSGTGIDTKFQKPMTLLIPNWLAQDLKIYIDSPQAQQRRQKSSYGESDENYVFLTKLGTPFYTSKAEQQELIEKIKASDSFGARLKLYEGEAVRSYLKVVLLPEIRLIDPQFPSFKFHDLRASFGMNLLESQLQHLPEGHSAMTAVEYVQARMGHRNIRTTLQYLNYKSRLQWRNKIQHEYESSLMKYVQSSVNLAGDLS